MRNISTLPETKRYICLNVSLFLVFVIMPRLLFAQEFVIPLAASEAGTRVVNDHATSFRSSFSYHSLFASLQETNKGTFSELYIPGAYFTGDLGSPKLPATKKLIHVPFGASVSVKVLDYKFEDFKLDDFGLKAKLLPVQPSLRKDQEADGIPFEFNAQVYEKDSFVETQLANVEILGVMRGFRIARLTIAPVAYNPAKNLIRVYNDIEVEISFSHVDEVLNQSMLETTYSPYFEPLQKMFLNNPFPRNSGHSDLARHPVKYLIVSDRMFENELRPFIEWKTKKGFKVLVGYTDEVGATHHAIQQWVHNQYNASTPNDPAPSFLLLVGDTPLVPSQTGNSTGKMTDLYYASVDGDYFPEMYYGRFSANNSAQLISQIEKTLFYEQYQFADPSFLDKATLIAGSDATWNPAIAQPTIKYALNNYYNGNQGYSDIYSFLAAPYSGCFANEKVSVGVINYTAHCNQTSWSAPNLTQAMVKGFTNQGQYPLAIGNCCLSSDFGHPECLGETFLRTPGAGTVVYLGSAPNTYWFEDFYWSVGAFPLVGNNAGYVPSFAETSLGAYDAPFVSDYVSAGGIVFAGNLAVTEAHIQGYPTHSSAQYYWQAYNVLGDPSLVIYHTQGSPNMVEHSSFLPLGFDTFEVSAEPGSYVAISKDGLLLGAALTDSSGISQVPIQAVYASGMVDVVVTKPQFIPYQTRIPAAMAEQAHIVLYGQTINDAGGNNNGLADYGEQIGVYLTLKNVGATASGDLSIQISCTDPYVNLIGNTILNAGSLSGWEQRIVDEAFSLSIESWVPNQYITEFQLLITNAGNSWVRTLKIPLHAPVLKISQDFQIKELPEGNGNSKPDPGEEFEISVTISNTGSSDIYNIDVLAETQDDFGVVHNPSVLVNHLSPGQYTIVAFTVSADMNTPPGHQLQLKILAQGGPDNLYADSLQISITIGEIPHFIMGNGSISTCNAMFYDSGGSNGNYGNEENFTLTFFPENPQSLIRVKFHSFVTETGFDRLFIYNGSDTTASQIPGSPFYGTRTPGTVTAMNASGALTFRFVTDVSGSQAGWTAEISCFTLFDPPACADEPFPADGSEGIKTKPHLTWQSADAIGFDVYLGPTINPPLVHTVTEREYQPELLPNTTYFWKIIARNQAGQAENCPLWSFSTGAPEFEMANKILTVNNGMFYDSGGPDLDYGTHEDLIMTFFPFVSGYLLEFDFTGFETTPNNGFLYVFDGPDISALLIQGSPFHGLESPGKIVSSHNTGALTFRFVSGGAETKPGWAASFRCLGPLAAFPSASSNAVCEGHSAQLYANATGGTGNYTYLWEPASGLNHTTIANPVAMPAITTTYSVRVDDGENVATGFNTLVLNTTSGFSLGNDTILCSGFALLLDATQPDAVSYYWRPGGETTATIYADSSGVGLGRKSFTAIVTDVNGCVSQASVSIVFDACTGAENEPNTVNISVFPNPAASMLNLRVGGYYHELSYSLVNHHGQVLLTKHCGKISGQYSEEISTEHLARGIYFLRLFTNNSVVVRKIILY